MASMKPRSLILNRDRKNWQRLLAIFCLVAGIIPSQLGWGQQFDRFKSSTNFNPEDEGGDSAESIGDLQEATPEELVQEQQKRSGGGGGSNNDVFGRGTGINNSNQAPKNGKYVNLNPETAFGPEVVESFDFPDANLIDLTKHMQNLTGINLIIDKDLKGKISIMAPSPITVGDAWKAYLTALNLNGYTLVKSGAFYKVVNARDVRYTPTKIYTGTFTPETENYAMRIIPLKNISAEEITRSFRPFLTRYGRIIDIKQTNTVIVQDTGSNINRLAQLIKFIDVPGHEETLQIIKVKNSSAQEIAKLLDQILKDNKSGKPSRTRKDQTELISKIIAEPRTNSIIAMANAEGDRRLRSLIKQLDVNVSSGTGQIHVYYLKHNDAEELSKTLSALVGSSQGAGGAQKNPRFARLMESENSLFNAEVKVTADKANNAIVVTASPTDYLTIREVINKLDIPKDQVFLEGMIMETNVKNSSDYGIDIVGLYGSGGAGKAGFSGGGNLVNYLSENITNLGGLFAGVGAGKKIVKNIGGKNIELNSINALIKAIATDSNTNVLATPQLLAQDNTEAVFEVGEKVPISKRTESTTGTATTAVDFQDVTLSLKFTPQINKVTRMVKLKIDQKIEDFSISKLDSGNNGVPTTVRSAITTVVVRDQDTVAMGGLMRDKEIRAEKKVPLLGDVPILGWLFKTHQREIEKVNLLFFLTPKIMATYEKTMASNTENTIDRREKHLKPVYRKGKDPFETTTTEIKEKLQKQKAGPLYDQKDVDPFINEEGIRKRASEIEEQPEEINLPIKEESKPDPDPLFEHDIDSAKSTPPDYQHIYQSVKNRQSSLDGKKD